MNGRSSSWIRLARPAPLALLVLLATSGPAAGAANEGSQESPAAVPPVLASTLLADDAAALPRPASSVEMPAADLTSAAPLRWSSSAEYGGGKYQWSASRGSLDIGLRFDAPNTEVRPFDFRLEGSGPVMSPLPAISLGLRQVRSPMPASTLLGRAMGGGGEGYVSKVGIEWKPAESNVQFLREGLGLRLDGDNRMTVRLRKGVLGIYMFRKF